MVLSSRLSVIGSCLALLAIFFLVWVLKGYDLRSPQRGLKNSLGSNAKLKRFFQQQERKLQGKVGRSVGGGDSSQILKKTCHDVDASADGKLSLNEITWAIQKRVKVHMARYVRLTETSSF